MHARIQMRLTLDVDPCLMQFRSTEPGTYPVISPGELNCQHPGDLTTAGDLTLLAVQDCLKANLAKLPGKAVLTELLIESLDAHE